MEDVPEYHGSLVAFEGLQDTITTQLRLLPSSPKILILPSIQQFIKSDERTRDTEFDPREYVLKIHEACAARAEVAHAFLQESSSSNKRLVFMSGGTAGAQMNCITAIAQHETDGDHQMAELMFAELVKNGVAGLKRKQTLPKSSVRSQKAESVMAQSAEDRDLLNDPISRAMRAAEALDKETEALQPNTDLDLTIATRRRSLSVPMRRMADDFADGAPFYVFGAQTESSPLPEEEEFEDEEVMDLKHLGVDDDSALQNPRFSTLHGDNNLSDPNQEAEEPSCVGEVYALARPYPETHGLLSSKSAVFESAPLSPAVFGEACVVDVRSSLLHSPHKRVKSVDRIYASAIRNQDIALCNFTNPATGLHQQEISDGVPGISSLVYGGSERPTLRSKFSSESPRGTLVKPNTTVIRRGPPTPLDLTRTVRPLGTYTDRGTNPEHVYVDQATSTDENYYIDQGVDAGNLAASWVDLDEFELGPDMLFQTVLPIVEDLVIHFKDEQPDTVLEAMINGFKTGTYPVSMPPLLAEEEAGEDAETPRTPLSRRSIPAHTSGDDVDEIEPTQQNSSYAQSDPDEYDPFASHGGYLKPQTTWPEKQNMNETSPTGESPPTPAQTPPPTIMGSERIFHEFLTTDCRTAVSMQNSLRSILNIYFSPEDAGYHQFNFPLLPELSSLWKPVFREAEPGSPRKENRKIDLILAMGAQKSVNKDFLAAISGSLEKLGTKPSGVTRSGRLDLRYLIANAMQAFTAQPLANQTQDNPFSNPLLLATLIIPHLETYMAAHSQTRFLLLEYPAEHLTTVLAIQRLVGVDLLKVAGILDAESHEPKSIRSTKPPSSHNNTHSATPSISGMSTSSTRTATTLFANGTKAAEAPSFSKANFLLTPTATNSEIATFISTIWRILIDVSHFYIPEGAPETSKRISKRNSSRELEGKHLSQSGMTDSQYAPFTSAAIMMGFHTPPVSPAVTETKEAPKAALTPSPPRRGAHVAPAVPPKGRSSSPVRSSKASISDSVKTKTTKAISIKSSRSKLNKLLGKEVDDLPAPPSLLKPDSASFWDISDDEENRFLDEERKYMPLFGKRPEVRKGNSRKALKWLGLA